MRVTRPTVFGLVFAASAIAGATTACLVIAALNARIARSSIPTDLLLVASGVGAGFGVLIGPVTALTMLRQVPMGLGLIYCSIGAAVGVSVGLYLGSSNLNPYAPAAIYRSPIPQAFVGAALGVVCAAYFARRVRAARDKHAPTPANVR